MQVPTLEELLEAGCHFGHQARRWHPKMKPYIYTVRGGVHIFDLVKTQSALKAAAEFVEGLGKEGKTLLMVGTKRQAKVVVAEAAKKAGAFWVSERWLGGILTNWEEIKKRLNRLAEMKQKRESGEYTKYTKKENLLIDRNIAKMERFLGGLAGLTGLPDAMFVVDTHKEIAAVREAKLKGVTIVGMVDTNADPTGIAYVIPVNDDAVRSVKLVVEKIGEAYAASRHKKA
jgi:small subunit ribosomal protein S2